MTPREFTQPEPQRIHSGESDPFTLRCKVSYQFPTMEPVTIEFPARKTTKPVPDGDHLHENTARTALDVSAMRAGQAPNSVPPANPSTQAVITRPAECTADGNREDAQNGSNSATGGREYRPGPNNPRSEA